MHYTRSHLAFRDIAIGVFIAAVSVLCVGLFGPHVLHCLAGWYGFTDPQVERLGQWGDMYGFVNALFSGVALFLVGVTLLLQTKELSAAMEELRTVKSQFEKQCNLIGRQTFEQGFFTMIELHERAIDALRFMDPKSGKWKNGLDVFGVVAPAISVKRTEIEKLLGVHTEEDLNQRKMLAMDAWNMAYDEVCDLMVFGPYIDAYTALVQYLYDSDLRSNPVYALTVKSVARTNEHLNFIKAYANTLPGKDLRRMMSQTGVLLWKEH